MLDLHCHLLPGIDDGAVDLDMALEMARMAVADGITTVACTPHIYPGMYDNTGDGIRSAVEAFRLELAVRGIELALVEGADVHLDQGLTESIRAGRIPTLAGSRYLLLEPPHHVAPPRFEETVFQLMVAGYVPVITHPERLSWIEGHYEVFQRLVKAGMDADQRGASRTFRQAPALWAERMIDESLVHILATDAHHPRRRPPLLAEGREAAARRVGEQEATHMVFTRPQGIVDNLEPGELPALVHKNAHATPPSLWRRLLGQA